MVTWAKLNDITFIISEDLKVDKCSREAKTSQSQCKVLVPEFFKVKENFDLLLRLYCSEIRKLISSKNLGSFCSFTCLKGKVT